MRENDPLFLFNSSVELLPMAYPIICQTFFHMENSTKKSQAFFQKATDQAQAKRRARHPAFFAKLSFSWRITRRKHSTRGFLPSFFSKSVRSSSSEAKSATFRFLCQAFFLVKESGFGRLSFLRKKAGKKKDCQLCANTTGSKKNSRHRATLP